MPRRKGFSMHRDDIVAAALACLEEGGEAALGINKVARRLEVKPSSLYNHVSGQAELQRLLALTAWSRLSVMAEEVLWREADREATAPFAMMDNKQRKKLLRDVLWRMRDFAKQQPDLYAILSKTSMHPSEEDFAPVARPLLQGLSSLLAAFGLPEAAIVHALRTIRAGVHGFVMLELGGQLRMDEQADESFDWMLHALVASVCTNSA